jgi:hypothetical protein
VSDFAKFKSDINRAIVTGQLLGDVMLAYAAMPIEARSVFENRVNRVLDLLEEKGHGKNRGLLAMAITVRLMALDAILGDERIEGWTIRGREPGMTYVHADLLSAAAEEPVLEDPRGEPVFDTENFRRRVLEITGTRGHA